MSACVRAPSGRPALRDPAFPSVRDGADCRERARACPWVRPDAMRPARDLMRATRAAAFDARASMFEAARDLIRGTGRLPLDADDQTGPADARTPLHAHAWAGAALGAGAGQTTSARPPRPGDPRLHGRAGRGRAPGPAGVPGRPQRALKLTAILSQLNRDSVAFRHLVPIGAPLTAWGVGGNMR